MESKKNGIKELLYKTETEWGEKVKGYKLGD